MGESEVEPFLTHLAVNRHVTERTQDRALGAIPFLYRHVLAKALGSFDAVRANGPKRLPTAASHKLNSMFGPQPLPRNGESPSTFSLKGSFLKKVGATGHR